MRPAILLPVLLLLFTCARAQEKRDNPGPKKEPVDSIYDYKIAHRSVTYGSVTVEGNIISYQAVAGNLVLKNAEDTPTISISYVAYFKTGTDPDKRPITFVYNGGPGSSTVWLHMGAWGPQRVYLNDTGFTRPPYRTVNNDYSLLDASDLVFIDAPGTGFGEIITKKMGGTGEPKDFFGIDEDGDAFTSFITQFLTTFHRWSAPKYLFGESYGTFRSAVVANKLHGADVDLNGVILLSQLLTYENMTEEAGGHPGNDWPYILALPSYAATAWYHHRLPSHTGALGPLVDSVEDFAMNGYLHALSQGALLDSASRMETAEKMHEYTGLPVAYILKANLRINGPQFEQSLLGASGQITGRLDARFSGDAIDPLSEYAQYDPMDAHVDAPFAAAMNEYVRTVLKFGGDKPYKMFGNVHPWNYKRRQNSESYPNVMTDLANAMILNPQMKVMLNMGYFDLGTPFFEGMYEMRHLPMPVALQRNIEYDLYQSGHMVYLHTESLKELHDRVARFILNSH